MIKIRQINDEIHVTESTTTVKVATAEEITHFTVNLKVESIEVSVQKTDIDGVVLQSEFYRFGGSDFLSAPNTSYLWSLIDRDRSL